MFKSPSLLLSVLLLLLCIYISFGASYKIPCIVGTNNVPAGCEERVVPCGKTPVDGTVKAVLNPTHDTWCPNYRVYIPDIDIVQWVDRNNTCWEIKMAIGECWGINPLNGGNYGCMGKCGAGCGNIDCGAWARDCLRHDACSWFHVSTDGANDPNCGYTWVIAEDDFLLNRFCTASDCKDLSVCR